MSPTGIQRTNAAPGSFVVEDPLAALQALARESRRLLGARVVGVTGSVGKTSVKDIARALLPGKVHANRENLNTEIGLPLTILEAPDGAETLVLEMAMRGKGQIAELTAIAEPEVAVITNVGPVHVELLGSVGGDRGGEGRDPRRPAARAGPRWRRWKRASWSRTWSRSLGSCGSDQAATSRRAR